MMGDNCDRSYKNIRTSYIHMYILCIYLCDIYKYICMYVRDIHMMYPWIRDIVCGHMAFVINTPVLTQWCASVP